MILLVDNYDSFVHNLARYLRELGEEVVVRRNDAVDVARARELSPGYLVISPGPCTPAEAGASCDLITDLAPEIPVLGVCLGHQCIGAAYGGRVVPALRPMHGKLSAVHHERGGLFAGLPEPLQATRYHSLVVDRDTLPPELEVAAWTEVGEVMALHHRDLPVWGVQFHPEAVLTDGGHRLLANFLALGRGADPEAGFGPGPSPEITAEAHTGRPA